MNSKVGFFAGVMTAAVVTAAALIAPAAQAQTIVPAAVSVESTAPAPQSDLNALLERMDQRAAAVKTLEADLTISTRDDITGRASSRAGKLYLRKPSDLYLDIKERGLPRRIWVTEKQVVDYRPDLESATVVALAPEGADKPFILGLSTTSKELRENFGVALAPPGPNPQTYTLTIVPKPDRDFPFSSAEIYLDAKTLLPVKVIEHRDDFAETRTYSLTSIRENARLRGSLFEPDLPRGTEIGKYEAGEWKGI